MGKGLFQYLKNVKDVLITTHRHADIDAYSSVYAIAKILTVKGINFKIYFPCGLNNDAKRISALLSLPNILTNFEKSEVMIVLDTANPALLPNITDHINKVIIIDHHPLLENRIKGIEFIDTKASSTCEIICRLLIRSKIKLTKEIATALLLGIFTDSQHLALANEQTISCINHLTRFTSLAEIRKLLTKERSYSERMARLKAAKRMELYKIAEKDLIIAVSNVGSYHASAARSLIDAGADLSIVTSKENDIIKVSMRASNRFYSLTNLHLGIDIASKISNKGGGHATAASFNVEKDVINDLLKIIGMNYKINKINV